MNASVYPLTQGKYPQGEYTVAAGLQKDELIEWIKWGEFRNFERDQFKISQRPDSNNTVYAFFLPSYPAKLAMKRKIPIPNPNFHFLKRIRNIRRKYSSSSGRSIPIHRAFFSSCLLYDKGVPVARPLAYWTFRNGRKNGL